MGFRLMIVDDSSSMRAIVKRTVEMSGFDVEQFFVADNGKTALELLDEEWVDVILTDLNMPVMDGEAFLAALKENPMFPKFPLSWSRPKEGARNYSIFRIWEPPLL